MCSLHTNINTVLINDNSDNNEMTFMTGIELHQAVEALMKSWITLGDNNNNNNDLFSVRVGASLSDAFATIRHHNVVPDEAVYTALALVRRLLLANGNVAITRNNASTIFLTALLIAGKIWLDVPFNTVSFGMLNGVNAKTMFQFETRFLNMLEWEVVVSDQEIITVAKMLNQI